MRSSGILLHISSLPSSYGIGSFGKSAYQFIDFLAHSKQKYWQVLPLGPTSFGDSPYQTFSAFAGNPYFIDLEILQEEGLLLLSEFAMFENKSNKVDFNFIYNTRFLILKKAFERFDCSDKDFIDFVLENNDWLNDYALFMAIKSLRPEGNWSTWSEKYKYHDKKALEEFQGLNEDAINFWKFIQYEFFIQWYKLKGYANEKGIKIIGDIPIYVAYDSSDVWSNPSGWNLDDNLNPIDVAGCPPDSFAITGQLWGNPIYNYSLMEKEGFKWWIKRIKESLKLYDVVRIDHFRGFESYYSIPFLDKTAENGRWIKGPGIKLFKKIEESLGKVKIIAEDLGFLTEDVYKLLEESTFPGMKVLQFGFDVNNDSEYAIHNLTKHSVLYTGTHDNSTSLGWYKSLDYKTKDYVNEYLQIADESEINDKIIRASYMSVCDTLIIPLQDYLQLDDEARFNIPSTLGNNWTWRLVDFEGFDALSNKIANLVKVYRR